MFSDLAASFQNIKLADLLGISCRAKANSFFILIFICLITPLVIILLDLGIGYKTQLKLSS